MCAHDLAFTGIVIPDNVHLLCAQVTGEASCVPLCNQHVYSGIDGQAVHLHPLSLCPSLSVPHLSLFLSISLYLSIILSLSLSALGFGFGNI